MRTTGRPQRIPGVIQVFGPKSHASSLEKSLSSHYPQTNRQSYNTPTKPYLHQTHTMETTKPTSASPQGSNVDDGATNASIHQICNGIKKQSIADTPMATAKAATEDVRHGTKRTFEEHNPYASHGLSTEPRKRRKVDHAIEHEEEGEEEVEEEEDDEEEEEVPAPLSLPTFSLAHRGDFSGQSTIPYYTAERSHGAHLAGITGEDDGVFTCDVVIQIRNTAESCTGICNVPVAEMDSNLTQCHRKHCEQSEDVDMEKAHQGCTCETPTGKVRLGRVIGEDKSPGTYTCEAEFGRFGAANPWVAEVYVPKKHVPGYKLVDWEGEQNAVASIETSSEDSEAPEQEPARRHTVEFSRRIENHQEQMSATFYSLDGTDDRLQDGVQILANEFDGAHMYLEFRVREDDASWWHFHGCLDRGLTHGRFYISSSAIPNKQSDEKFDKDWTERPIQPTVFGAPQRLRATY